MKMAIFRYIWTPPLSIFLVFTKSVTTFVTIFSLSICHVTLEKLENVQLNPNPNPNSSSWIKPIKTTVLIIQFLLHSGVTWVTILIHLWARIRLHRYRWRSIATESIEPWCYKNAFSPHLGQFGLLFEIKDRKIFRP